MKVYSAIYGNFAHLQDLGETQTVNDPYEMDSDDAILILHGGADISPTIYNKKPNPFTSAYSHLSLRDSTEVRMAKRAINLGIPIFGICRGAQLLCALAGGTLVQHTNNHTSGQHDIITPEGEIMKVTSCHHQMMNPFEIEHELLAWTPQKLSTVFLGEPDETLEIEDEPEIVYFPKINGLGIQGHPEWMHPDSRLVGHCKALIKEKLLHAL